VGLIFGIAQVITAASDRKERLTLEALRNFQTREFAELMYTLNTINTPSTFEELKTLTGTEQIKFMQFTQEMESLGILVAEQYISIELVDKTLGNYVTNSWDKLMPLISDIRESQSDPYMSEYFQWLAERLNERMQMNPRKPFYQAKDKYLNREKKD
jgi:hypothetical protein